MKSKEDALKIRATVTYILTAMQDGIDYIHLFKMMYFAQQEHLVTYGSPIMYDSFVARKHGPVPSLTYKVLRGIEGKIELETEELAEFADDMQVAESDGHQIVKLKEGTSCDMDELSGSDVRILDKWIAKCKDVDAFELSSLSHDRAWKKAEKEHELTGENIPIPLYDIAKAGAATEAMLNVIRERQAIRCALK